MSPEFASIPLDSLRFDLENPRLPEGLDSADLNAVLDFMLEDAGLVDLMGSIAKQGFFPGEPLLVSPSTDVQDVWVVVEGNRRFASCLLLVHPDLAPSRKRTVSALSASANIQSLEALPSLIFPNRDSILGHLGYRHVTGIKEWDPLAKARFLHQRFQTETGSDDERFKSLARSIGSRSDYVGRLLTAHQLYLRMEASNFFDIPGLSASTIDFSLITSLLAYAAVGKYLGLSSRQDMQLSSLDIDRLAFLTRFSFSRDDERKTALGESRNMGLLAQVLEVPNAVALLEEGATLTTAAHVAGAGAEAFKSLVAGAKSSLEIAFKELEGAPISLDDLEEVESVGTIASELADAVRAQLAGS